MSDDLSKAETREPEFYWVRATSGRPFEAACWRAEDNFWRFTDGSHMHASPNEIGPRIHAPDQPAQDDRAELIAAAQALLNSDDYADDSRPLMSDLRAALAKASPNQGSQQ